MTKFNQVADISGADKLKIDFTGSLWDGDGTEWTDAVNMEVINGGGEMGIALTSYTGDIPSGHGCADSDLTLKGEAWTDYAVRVKATEDIIKGVNVFEIDYTTAGDKFDASNITGIAIVGKDRSANPTSTCIQGIWAVKEAWPVDPAAQAVIDAIDALPEAGDVTFDDAAAIDAALAAYNELNENVKGEVTNADKLIQVKAAIDELFANADIIGVKTDWIYTSFYGDGFEFDAEAEKTYTVKAKISATAGETDERYIAKLQMISDADTQSSAKIMFSDYEARGRIFKEIVNGLESRRS